MLSVFVLSSSINYLDRQTLATLAPVIRGELHLSNAEYGWIVSAFSITYAACAPFAGLLIDRIGLYRGITFAIGMWSLAGLSTGWVRGFRRVVAPPRRPGSSRSGRHSRGRQGDPTLPAAPRAGARQQPQSGGCQPGSDPGASGCDLGCGAVQLASRIHDYCRPGVPLDPGVACCGRKKRFGKTWRHWVRSNRILLDRRLWGFALANGISMVPYSLWTNWTTLHLVDVNHLSCARGLVRLAAAAAWRAGRWPAARFPSAG